MRLTDVCTDFVYGLGKVAGGMFNALDSVRKALRRSAAKLRPQSPRERIRSIVIEELIRLMGEEVELTGAKFEERLKIMSEAIEALQEKISQLSARGLPHQALVSAAIASVEDSQLLSPEEKALLTSIFRQNIMIQKPELIDTAVEQNSLRIMSS